MVRHYAISWYPTREGDKLKRTTWIQINKAAGTPSIDAKFAVNLFCAQFGNLKKNTIICIKEFDDQYNQIGEDIVPTNGTNIVPIKKESEKK